MKKEMTLYKKWISQTLVDPDLSTELCAIQDNETEIYDRFYKELAFGTGGLRGIIGAGINRINIYTIGKATQGFANLLKNKYKNPSVAIAYDSRNKSLLFAQKTASVFASNGIKVYLYTELMPTPALSFAVRELGCSGGVMVTASHNPAKYNGYKAYGNDGCQMNITDSEIVMKEIEKVDLFTDVHSQPFEVLVKQGSIEYIPQEVTTKYLAMVKSQSLSKDILKNNDLSVVYTPLNGAGYRCVTSILQEIGVQKVSVVAQQKDPDGNFPTCPYPNPEFKEALAKGLELCEKIQPDLLIATDPDADRVGIAVKQGNAFVLISGNEVGALLLDFIAKTRTTNGTMPKKPFTVTTIVSTTMIDAIAKEYNIEVKRVLTGFKFIGEQMLLLEEKGELDRFIFGFEESYGYLAGNYVRDKDAVVASMLICEMAVHYKEQGKTLVDALHDLYKKHGIYRDVVENFEFEGADGTKKMQSIMETLANNPPKELGGYPVATVSDYTKSTITAQNSVTPIDLPKSNVLVFGLQTGSTITIRPSGTEPKIKVYYSLNGNDEQAITQISQNLSQSMASLLNK